MSKDFRKYKDNPMDVAAAAAAESSSAAAGNVDSPYRNQDDYDKYMLSLRMSNLVAANPGISPDVAYSAALAKLPEDSKIVLDLRAQEERMRIAAEAQQAAEEEKRRLEAEANLNPIVGIAQTASALGWAAIEAPFQVITNAVRVTTDLVDGNGKTSDDNIIDVFTNTDLGGMTTYALTGNEAYNPGRGWFGDTESNLSKTRIQEDREMFGDPNGPASLGQYAANLFDLQEGTTAFTVTSGAIDLITRIADPSMYVGAGEARSALKAAQGLPGVGDVAKGLESAKKLVTGDAAKDVVDNVVGHYDDIVADSANLHLERDFWLIQKEANKVTTNLTEQHNLRVATEKAAAESKRIYEETAAELQSSLTDAQKRLDDLTSGRVDPDEAARAEDLVYAENKAKEDILAEREYYDSIDREGIVEFLGLNPKDAAVFRNEGLIPRKVVEDFYAGKNPASKEWTQDNFFAWFHTGDPEKIDEAVEMAGAIGTSVDDLGGVAARAVKSRKTKSATVTEKDLARAGGNKKKAQEYADARVRRNAKLKEKRDNAQYLRPSFVKSEDDWAARVAERTDEILREGSDARRASSVVGDSGKADDIVGAVDDGSGGFGGSLKDVQIREAQSEIEFLQQTIKSLSDDYADEAAAFADEMQKSSETMRSLISGELRDKILNGKASRKELEKIDKRIKELTSQREQLENYILFATSEKLKSGVTDVNDAIGLLREAAGLRKGLNGKDTIAIDRAIQFFVGSGWDNASKGFLKTESLSALRDGSGAAGFYRIIAGMKDPAELYRLSSGKIPVKYINDLAKADNEDAVRKVFADMLSQGDLNRSIGKLRALRVASRVSGRETNEVVGLYNKAFGTYVKALSWGADYTKRNVPWASSRHIEDPDAMVDLVYSFGTFVTRSRDFKLAGDSAREWRQFTDEYTSKMISAEDASKRREIWYDFLDEFNKKAISKYGLDDEESKLFMDAFKSSRKRQEEAIRDNVSERVSRDGGLMIGNKYYDNVDWATSEQEMNLFALAPDPLVMRKALRSAKSLKKYLNDTDTVSQAVSDAVTNIFDRYWRTSVLAFRGGYILRNIGDIEVRMFLSRHPSMFTNPQGVLALALSHSKWGNSAFGKLLKKAERGNLDVDGSDLMKVDGEDYLIGESVNAFMDEATRNTSHLDPGSLTHNSALYKRGFKKVYATEDNFDSEFVRGWASDIDRLRRSPLADTVLRANVNRPSEKLQKWMNEQGINDVRQASVMWYWSGPGRKELDSLYGRIKSDDPLRHLLETRNGLATYMFGKPDAIGGLSLSNKWNMYTVEYNDNIIEGLLDKKFPVLSDDGLNYSKKVAASYDEEMKGFLNILKTFKDQALKQSDGFSIKSVDTPISIMKSDISHVGALLTKATDWFFGKSAVIEKHFGYLPEFRYAKWDYAADMIGALSPADAAAVLANARKALKGGAPGSWSRRTLSKLEKNAKKANGDGSFDVEDFVAITDKYAVDNIKNLFYDASKRNALAYQARYIFPFAQAFANSAYTWGRLAAENTQQVYKAVTLYDAAKGENSNWMWDDPSSPEDAFIYQDEITGEMKFGVPLVGGALSLIGSAIARAQGSPIGVGPQAISSPIGSYNLLFQNGMLPSAGPAITIPVSMIEQTEAFQKMPDALKTILNPYVQTDPERETGVFNSLVPGWVSYMLGGLGIAGFSEITQKYIKPAMAQLYSADPSRYNNQYGVLDSDGIQRLSQDSTALAQGLSFSRGLAMNLSAGQLKPDLMVMTNNGEWLPQTLIAKEYQNLYSASQNRETALNMIVDKYGIETILTIMPVNKYQVTPTKEAYDFRNSNGESADQHGSVLGLFFPGGGYSSRMDRWEKLRGVGGKLSSEEMLLAANGLLFDAQEAQLNRKLASDPSYTVERYEADMKNLNAARGKSPASATQYNWNEVLVEDVRSALNDPAITANSVAAEAARLYMECRDHALENAAGDGLDGKDDAKWRVWLNGVGNDLISKYPEFKPMWVKVFRNEVNK